MASLLRKSIFIAAIAWIIGAFAGAGVGVRFPLDGEFHGLNPAATLFSTTHLGILSNNAVVILLAALGLFTFGITTFLTVAGSGFVFGGVAAIAYQGGLTPSQLFWASAPHSIELVGLWLAASIGFLGPRFTFSLLGERPFLPGSPWKTLSGLFLAAMAITALAAFLEAEVTIGIIAEGL